MQALIRLALLAMVITAQIPSQTGPTGPTGPSGVTGPAGPTGPAGSLDAAKAQAIAAYGRTFWLMLGLLTLGSLIVIVPLNRDEKFLFSHVVSEEVTLTHAAPAADGSTASVQETVMVGSASRVIALFGLLMLAAIMLGIGNAIVWSLFVNGTLPPLDGIGPYLLGGSALFAPYAFNQLKGVFGPPAKP